MSTNFKNKTIALLSLAASFALVERSFAAACSVVGEVHFNPSTKAMELCDGSSWKVMGASLGDGTACHWEYWGSKGEGGNGKGSIYSLASGSPTPPNPESGAYCNLGEYIAGMVGEGITTGGKRDFGHIFCCPSSSTSTSTSTGTGTGVVSTVVTISGLVVSSKTSTSITLSWSTDVPATATVVVGSSATDDTALIYPTDGSLIPAATNQSFTVTGLSPSTSYYFSVQAEVANGSGTASITDSTISAVADTGTGTSSGTASGTSTGTGTGTSSGSASSTATSTGSAAATDTSTATGGGGDRGGGDGGGGDRGGGRSGDGMEQLRQN